MRPSPLGGALSKGNGEKMKLTAREIAVLKMMQDNEQRHADRCLGLANQTMAVKQRAWDLEGVAVLSKIVKHFEAKNEPGTTNEDKPFEPGGDSR